MSPEMNKDVARNILKQVDHLNKRGLWRWSNLRVDGRLATVDVEFDAYPFTVVKWFERVGAPVERIETIPGGQTVIMFSRGQW